MTPGERKIMYHNKEDIAVLKLQGEFIKETLHRIENNHLAHIETDMKKQACSIRAIEQKMDKKINHLENVQIGQSPFVRWVEKVFELIITAIVIAILVMIGLGKGGAI